MLLLICAFITASSVFNGAAASLAAAASVHDAAAYVLQHPVSYAVHAAAARTAADRVISAFRGAKASVTAAVDVVH